VELRRHLGEVFRRLAEQKESRIEEGHLLADHVHMLISIPPKYAVSQVIGFIKGKSAIHLARVYGERKRNFVGQHFWARGYFVPQLAGHRSDTGLHQEARRGGHAPRADELVALTAAFRWPQTTGAASATP
jgi:REP element-mobilizing transposase RayT